MTGEVTIQSGWPIQFLSDVSLERVVPFSKLNNSLPAAIWLLLWCYLVILERKYYVSIYEWRLNNGQFNDSYHVATTMFYNS